MQTPLAVLSAPPCSQRTGIRAVRSQVVQAGKLTASLSAQANRERSGCLTNAALWVTQNDVSQQFDLPIGTNGVLKIVDVAPDNSSILVTATDSDGTRPRMAIVPLRDGPIYWLTTADIAGLGKCASSFDARGYLDNQHVSIAALPAPRAHPIDGCDTKPAFYSYDLVNRSAAVNGATDVKRRAQVVDEAVRTCRADPDVVGACYNARARLEYRTRGPGLEIWTVGSGRLLAVEEGMIPNELSARVSQDMRVYATMLICPLSGRGRESRGRVCVESAKNLKSDPIPKRVAMKMH